MELIPSNIEHLEGSTKGQRHPEEVPLRQLSLSVHLISDERAIAIKTYKSVII
jgi:hypothetical protein